jgi:hypothetical protein
LRSYFRDLPEIRAFAEEDILHLSGNWKYEHMKYPIAWSLFLVAAVGCGEVSTKDEPDAGTEPDAGAEQPVKVRVLGVEGAQSTPTGNPDPKAIAIFVGADGSVIKDGVVGPQGESESLMPEGGMIQTIQATETSATTRVVIIMNFHDVKPGDIVGAGPSLLLPDRRGEMSPMTGTFTASTGYTHAFETDCGLTGSDGPTVTMPLYPNCRGTTVDLLAIQTPVQPSRLQPRFLSMSFPFVANGAFTISGNWVEMAPFTVALTNTPDDISAVTFRRWTQLKSGPSSRVASQSVTTNDPPAGTVSATLRYPQGVGNRAIVSAELSKVGAAPQRIDVQTQDVGNAQGIDASDLPLPWLSGVRFSAAQRKLTWTEAGTGTPDLRVGVGQFRYTRGEVMYAVTVYDFSAPTATPEMIFPALPPAYAEFDPAQQPEAPTGSAGIVGYIDQSDIDGYAQGRTQGFSLVTQTGTTAAFTDRAFRRRTTLALSSQ